VRDVTPSRRGGFCALTLPLRQVVWPEKFKAGHIDKYDGSNNPEEFIQVYHIVIEAAGGDDRVKVNYLPTTLFGMSGEGQLSARGIVRRGQIIAYQPA
jgi:hypothetical protein